MAGGICGNERPGKGFVGDGDWLFADLGGGGAPPRAGRTGLGLPGVKVMRAGVGPNVVVVGVEEVLPIGGLSRLALLLRPPLKTAAGFTGLSWPVLKGLLETSLEGNTAPTVPAPLSTCLSAAMMESGGSGGRCRLPAGIMLAEALLVGLGLGGKFGGGGGVSVTGDKLLTVATEAVEDRESLEEVRLILEGLSGDRLVSRSSEELLLLTVILFSLEARTFSPNLYRITSFLNRAKVKTTFYHIYDN